MDEYIVYVTLFICVFLSGNIYCQRTQLEYTEFENVAAHTTIGNIREGAKLDQTYGPDALTDIEFSFLQKKGKENYLNYFALSTDTGILRTIKPLDREEICEPKQERCEVSFDVVVRPIPVHYLEIISVRIYITDINDNQPTFPKESIDFQVSESVMPGVSFILPPAVDRDSGAYGIQGYNLVEQTETFGLSVTNTPDGTPDLRLVVLEQLDRERQSSYSMQVVALDGGDPPEFGSLTVNVEVTDANDNSPVFANASYNVRVPENAPVGSVVLRVHASDLDQDQNGQVVYNIQPASLVKAKGVININNQTGELYLEGPLDYEKDNVYRLLVTASDLGPDSVPSATRVVIHVDDVNDHKPAVMVNPMTSSGIVELSENTQGGQFVAHISVEDLDSGDNGRTHCELGDHRFLLKSVMPNAYMMNTARNVTFDREHSPEFSVPLLCRDFGIPPLETSVEITGRIMDINDNPPVFTQRVYAISKRENNTINEVLLRVNATDSDLGQNANVSYAIRGDHSRMVKINSRTGVIKARGVFDYESTPNYQFQVVAYDHGDPMRSSTATVVLHLIDVNDEPPLFYRDVYNFVVTEHQQPPLNVGTVAATDRDADPYRDIIFSLVHNERKRAPFEIDPVYGKIRTTEVLDREKTAYYTLYVAAHNPGTILTSTATVHVRIIDINDNAPVIHFPASTNNSIHLECIYASRDPVIRVDARDPDEGSNGRLTFSMPGESAKGVFEINPNTGAISVLGGRRRVEYATYNLVVMVSDHGDQPKESMIPFSVTVNNTGPCPPDAALKMSSVQITANRNRIILISLGVVTLFLVLILLMAIFALRRKDNSRSRKEYRYACPVRFRQKKNPKATENCTAEPAERVGSLYSFNTEDECKEKHIQLQLQNHVKADDRNATVISGPWQKSDAHKDKVSDLRYYIYAKWGCWWLAPRREVTVPECPAVAVCWLERLLSFCPRLFCAPARIAARTRRIHLKGLYANFHWGIKTLSPYFSSQCDGWCPAADTASGPVSGHTTAK